MGRPKSFVAKLSIDNALSSHNCQHNSAHRIHKGDARLKVRVERSDEHYCLTCAKQFLEMDVEKLQALLRQMSGSSSTTPE